MARIATNDMKELEELFKKTNIRERVSKAENYIKNRKVAVMNFGRLNPPHKGHLELLQFISNRASILGGEGFVFLSASKNYLPPHKGTKWRGQTQRTTKSKFYSLKSNENPLGVFEKIPILKKFPKTDNIQYINPQAAQGRPYTMDRAIDFLREKGYNEIQFVVGTDRYKQLKEKGVDKKWNVILVEHPRAESLENETFYSLGDNIPKKALTTDPQLISGTKTRAAAAEHAINIPGINGMTQRQAKIAIYDKKRGPIHKGQGWYRFKEKMPDNISDPDLEFIIYKIKKGMLLYPSTSYFNNHEKSKMVRRNSTKKIVKKGGRKTRKRCGRGKTKKKQKIKKRSTTIKLKRPAWYKKIPPMEYTDKINEEFAKEAVYRLYKENPNLPTITKEDAKMLMSDEELAKNLQGVNFTGGVKHNKGWATLKSKKGEKAKAIRKNRDLEMEVTRPLDINKIFDDQLKVRKLKDNINNALLQYQDSENKLNKLNIKQLVKDKRPMWPRKLIQKRRNTRKLIKSNKENIKKAEEALKKHENMMKENDILTFGKGWGLNSSGQSNKYIKHKMYLKGKPINGGRRTRKKGGKKAMPVKRPEIISRIVHDPATRGVNEIPQLTLPQQQQQQRINTRARTRRRARLNRARQARQTRRARQAALPQTGITNNPRTVSPTNNITGNPTGVIQLQPGVTTILQGNVTTEELAEGMNRNNIGGRRKSRRRRRRKRNKRTR